MNRLNQRQRALLLLLLTAAVLLAVALLGALLSTRAQEAVFSRTNLPPGLPFLFGTDWMGRDMLARPLAGLSLSLRIGALPACVRASLALILGVLAALNRRADALISWCIDLFLGIPHILLVMLISLAFGRGFVGVVAGVSLSHWPSLARLVRGEILPLRQAPYFQAAERLGVSRWKLVRLHFLPHLLPQFLTGLVLQFPHAILHEASVTFLGFGLSPEQPAVGVILSESMRYLTTGRWWLALFPGLALVGVVLLFAALGEQVRRLLDPSSVHA